MNLLKRAYVFTVELDEDDVLHLINAIQCERAEASDIKTRYYVESECLLNWLRGLLDDV